MQKLSGDVLAMKKTCSGGDIEHVVPRDVLTKFRRTFGEVSPIFRRIFGGAFRGLISATSANS